MSSTNVTEVHKVGVKIARHYMSNLKGSSKAGKYLESRGLNHAWAIENGIGYGKDSWSDLVKSLSTDELKIAHEAGFIGKSLEKGNYYDLYRDRIIFPILSNDANLVGFGGRYIGEADEAKYINTRDTEWFNKSVILYNLSKVTSLAQKDIAVVEGYMDVIAARHSGLGDLTAVMGTAFTELHANEVIKRGVNSVTFCFDGDNAGFGAALKTLNAVAVMKDANVIVKYAFLPEGMDPDDVIQKSGPDAFRDHLNSGIGPEEFIARVAINECAGNRGSIDLTIASVTKALNTAIDNKLNPQLVWQELSRAGESINQQVATAVIKRHFPDVGISKQGAISTTMSDDWQNAKQPT